MRSVRQTTLELAWPSLRDARGRLLGLPFVVTAAVPGTVMAWQAWLASLLIASVATFLVYVPVTALVLNGGAALKDDQPAPALTIRAYVVLLVLWTMTAWLGAVLAAGQNAVQA
jgi:hypothetical protein